MNCLKKLVGLSLIWAIAVLGGSIASSLKPLVSNKAFFNLGANDNLTPAEHRIGKRSIEDVSAIVGLYNDTRIDNFTQQEKDAILAKHIEFRSQTEPEASNMEYMKWDDELAYTASLWASVCYWGHGQPNITTSFDSIGQNLWLGGSKPDGPGGVAAWHDNEKHFYNYEDTSCQAHRICGHYTQVIWAETKYVGCGRAFCSEFIDNEGNPEPDRVNKWILACNYSPTGNYPGVKPFKSGPRCTECESGVGHCYDNACRNCSEHNDTCDCRQICNNCGTLTSECSCTCVGTWYGTSCSDVCVDTHEYCYNNPGWPNADSCGLSSAVPKGCPLMCRVCEPDFFTTCVTTTVATTTTQSTITTAPGVTTATITTASLSSTTSVTNAYGCTNTCKHQGTLQENCKCKCLSEYTGTSCERLIEEVKSGVAIIFAEHISHYTSAFEMMLRETVSEIITIHCNDNFQQCCNTDQEKKSGTFDFISYRDVLTAEGYPAVGDTDGTFVALVVIKMPNATDLCENGTQSATRRKRDVKFVLSRYRRADEPVVFFDQSILFDVIKSKLAVIEANLNTTVNGVELGKVTETSGSGPSIGMMIGVTVAAVVLGVFIIAVIAFLVITRYNNRQKKTDDQQWASKDTRGDKFSPKVPRGWINRNNVDVVCREDTL